MAGRTHSVRIADRDLLTTRTCHAPAATVCRCWTDPDLLKQWFAPPPGTTPVAEFDVRPGGAGLIVMKGPDGGEIPCRGIQLDMVAAR